MKTGLKTPKNARKANFEFEVVCLAVAVRRDFTFSVFPLHVRSNWYSLVGLNCPNGTQRSRNKKLYKFLRANSTKKQRDELMKKVCVLFD
jgi:hypothetical protein